MSVSFIVPQVFANIVFGWGPGTASEQESVDRFDTINPELEIAEMDGNGERLASRKPSWLTQALSTPGREWFSIPVAIQNRAALARPAEIEV